VAKLISEERLLRMTQRQAVPAWGKEYQPAIRATPQEAPRISRPSQLQSALVGRKVHLLSQPETAAALLALHHPDLLDLHEQRLLSTVPAAHPLRGSPYDEGQPLTELKGTVDVAARLERLSKHPKLFVTMQDGERTWVPFPYVGDLLLFLRDGNGPYCIAWNVKLTSGDYLRPGPRSLGRVVRQRIDTKGPGRHEVEETYYSDAGIRTVRVAGAAIDAHLLANLREIFCWHGRQVQVEKEVEQTAADFYRARIGTEEPAFDSVREVARLTGMTTYSAKVLLYRGIWSRTLHVDLFKPVLMDRPLRSQGVDCFTRYREWFTR
jgi:hypothetical protein